MRRSRGFTVLELLVATTILGMLIGAVFFAFDYGARSFRISNSRQSVQGDLTRSYTSLREDLRKTHFRMVSAIERTQVVDGENVRRDAICLGGLQDWSSPSSFDEVNGLPKWDRYMLYYATADGKFVKAYLDPAVPDFSPVTFDLDQNLHLNDDPATNDSVQSGYVVLSTNCHEFETALEPAQDRVDLRLSITEDGGREDTSAEVRLQIIPKNTWPRTEG